nr:stalk domain-containing protein [Paenibacillus sp. Soil522]
MDGVTYVAARAYGEALGATVAWDVKTNITSVE